MRGSSVWSAANLGDGLLAIQSKPLGAVTRTRGSGCGPELISLDGFVAWLRRQGRIFQGVISFTCLPKFEEQDGEPACNGYDDALLARLSAVRDARGAPAFQIAIACFGAKKSVRGVHQEATQVRVVGLADR